MRGNSYVPFMLRRGDGSTLSLDFASMGELDSRFTFTRNSIATFINSSGLIEQVSAAPSNDPSKARFDYNPTTLARRGLLIEASAINLCLQSAAVRSSGWTPVGLTTQGPSITAPDGTSSGVEVVPSNATVAGNAYSVQSVTASALTSYTLSVWVKPIGTAFNTRIRLTSIPGGTDAITATISNANGTIAGLSTGTNWTYVSATSTPYPNGWYRIALTGTTPSGTTHLQMVLLFSGTGDGTTGAYFWGAQMEAGSMASSYIPTGASTVQRASELCQMSGTNFSSWFQAGNAYSMLYRYSLNSPTAWAGSGIDRACGQVSQNATNPRTFIYAAYRVGNTSGDIGRFVRILDTGSLDMQPATLPAAATNTALAFAVNTNDAAIYGTNGVVGTDSSCTILTGQNLLDIGAIGSSQHLNGCISLIKYWPTRLPNATLQRLTA